MRSSGQRFVDVHPFEQGLDSLEHAFYPVEVLASEAGRILAAKLHNTATRTKVTAGSYRGSQGSHRARPKRCREDRPARSGTRPGPGCSENELDELAAMEERC